MTVNLTFDIADLIGSDFDARRTKVWIETNIDGDAIVDAAGNTVRLGDAKATVNADGTGSFTGLTATNAATNPTGFQYRVWVDYPKATGQARAKWSSGWFSLTATTDLADVVAEQYVPPTYVTQATQTLDAHAATLQAPMDAAVSSAQGYASDAAASAQTAHDISGISTSDGVVKALVDDPASQTRASLTTTIAGQVGAKAVPLGARSGGQWVERPNPFAGLLRPGPARPVRTRTPDVSYGSTFSSTTIANAVTVSANSSKIRRLGTGAKPYRSFTSSTSTFYTADATGDAGISTWEFETDAQVIEILMFGTAVWNLMVDGEYAFPRMRSAVTDASHVNGDRYWVKIDLGTRKPGGRTLTLFGRALSVSAFAVGPNDTVRLPRTPVGPRLAVMSNSYGQGVSYQGNAGPWWPLADRLGIRDVVLSSVGGTGYLNANTSYTTYRQRIGDIANAGADIVITADPLNDQGRQTKAALLAETTAYFAALRAALPSAVLIASGTFTPLGTNVSNGAYIDTRDAVKQGLATVAGPWLFIDCLDGSWTHSDGRTGSIGGQWQTGTGKVGAPSGSGTNDLYVSSDGTHPEPYLGHEWLGEMYAAAIVDGLNLGSAS